MQKFDIESCHGLITTTNYDVIIDCTFNEFVQNNIVQYSAAAPPDYRTSFSGSGLPYHNKDQAYYKTPNQGTVKLNNNQCKIKILKPNSYYADFNNLELPYINLMYFCMISPPELPLGLWKLVSGQFQTFAVH